MCGTKQKHPVLYRERRGAKAPEYDGQKAEPVCACVNETAASLQPADCYLCGWGPEGGSRLEPLPMYVWKCCLKAMLSPLTRSLYEAVPRYHNKYIYIYISILKKHKY